MTRAGRFQPVHIAVLTVSDTRGEAEDTSGRTLVELIARDGHKLADRAIVKDDRAAITEKLQTWIADPRIEVVISTGGTGVTGRDITPEAFEALFEKKIDGFGELFRWLSFQKIGTSTMQSRAVGGRGRRHLSLRPPRLPRRLPRRLGGYPALAARHPLPPLQPRRADAAPAGAFEEVAGARARGWRLASFARFSLAAEHAFALSGG